MKTCNLFFVLALATAAPAHADTVSKNAGLCVAYKAAAQDKAGATLALNTATNRQLAMNHANATLDEMKRLKSKGVTHAPLMDDARKACAAVGIK